MTLWCINWTILCMSRWNKNAVYHHVFEASWDMFVHNSKLFSLYLMGGTLTIIYHLVVKFPVRSLGCFNTSTAYVWCYSFDDTCIPLGMIKVSIKIHDLFSGRIHWFQIYISVGSIYVGNIFDLRHRQTPSWFISIQRYFSVVILRQYPFEWPDIITVLMLCPYGLYMLTHRPPGIT